MKRILSLITGLILLINLCPCLNACAEDAPVTDPYETIQTVTSGTPHQSTTYYPGGIDANKSLRISQTAVMFTNLKFSEGVQRFTLGIGGDVRTNTIIRIYIFPAGEVGVEDSRTLNNGYTTTNGYLIKDGSRIEPHYTKQIVSGTYIDWQTPIDVTIDIPDGGQYTGLYDVLIGGDVEGGNLFSLTAESLVSDVELGAVLTDIDGNTTDNISEAAAIEASARGSIAACEEKTVELYLGVYDSDNNLLYKDYMPYIASSSQTIQSGTIEMTPVYNNGAVMSGAAYAAVYMTVNGKLLESKYFGTRPSESATSESFADEISASANEGMVTVSGKIELSNSSVMVMMKNGADIMYMRSVLVNDGNYKCVFSPDVVTDTYDIIVTGNKKGEYNTTVDFVSYKSIIDSINNAEDAGSLYNIFSENEDAIGINLADSAGDSEWIFEQIYAKRVGIKNVTAAANMFNKYVALSAVNTGNPDKAVKEYSDILEISDSYKALYSADESSASTLKDAVSEYIAENGKITEPEIFIEVLFNAIVSGKVMTAYKSHEFANQPDKGGYGRVEDGAIADVNTGSAYVKFANMDFGTDVPKTIAVTYATTMVSDTAVWLCVDSKDNVIKKLKTQNTGSWSDFITDHFVLTDTEAKKLSGVHDIYIMFKQKGNYKTLAFTKEYVAVNDFTLTCDSEEVNEITTITVAANGYIYNGQSNKVSIVGAAYDTNGSLIKSGADSDAAFDNSSFNRSVTVSGINGAASVYAGLINAVNGKITVLSHETHLPIGKTVEKQSHLAEASNGSVYIYGTAENASDVTLFVKKSDTELTNFDEYALIYGVTADDNGVFSYEFKMPAGFLSGDYDMLAVDSEGNNYKCTFNYASLEDSAKVLTLINSVSNAAELKEYISNPAKNEDNIDIAKLLGLDLNVINAYPDSDKIYSEALTYMNDGFKSVADIASAFKNAEFIYKLNNDIDMGSLYDAVKDNAKDLGIADSDIYKNYFAEFDSDRQVLFNQKLKELTAGAATAENIVDTIIKAVAVTGFTNELSWGKIDGMLNAFADVFEEANRGYKATLSSYNALSDTQKHTVCSNYVLKTGLTVSSIASSLAAYYNNAVKTPSSILTGGGSGSGGGGSGGFIQAVGNSAVSTQNQSTAVATTTFKDLSGYDWAAEAIKALAARGIVEGRDENTFDPASKVTREEFATLLIKAFDNAGEGNASFTDVADNAWYKNYVARAVEKNIVNGYPDGSFGVGKSITREDMCVMVRRAMSAYNIYALKDKNTAAAFVDMESAAEYAQEDIMALARMGIVSGTGNDSFSPKANTTRAEAAVIIYRGLGM